MLGHSQPTEKLTRDSRVRDKTILQQAFTTWLQTRTPRRHTTHLLLNSELRVVASDPPQCHWIGDVLISPIGRYLPGLFPEVTGNEEQLQQLIAHKRMLLTYPRIWRLAADGSDRYLCLCLEPALGMEGLFLATVEDVTSVVNLNQRVETLQQEVDSLQMQLSQAHHQLNDLLQTVVPQQLAEELISGEDAPILNGQLQEATILCADLRGFAQFGRDFSPQRTLGKVNKYLAAAVEVIRQHQGTVSQYTSDLLFATYNVPVAQPHHALLAARTAVALRQVVQELVIANRDERRAPDFGIGISTGNVIVGYVGTDKRFEYRAVGEAVNLASHLCDAAAKGQILLGSETCRRLYGRAITKTFGGLNFKNGSATPVYELSSLAG